MKHKFNSESGMTLIELMFAAGVLAVGLSMLFGSLISVNQMSKLTESRTLAAADLNTLMEGLLDIYTMDQIVSYSPPQLQSLPLEEVTAVCIKTNEFGVPDPDVDPIDLLATAATAASLAGITPPVAVELTIKWYIERRQVTLKATKLIAQ